MLLAVPAALAQDEGPARQVLDGCIDSLDAEVVGLTGMEESCPGLEAALEQLGIAALLPSDQHQLLTRNGLINLRSLLDRYAQPSERSQVAIDSLQPVLDSLREPAEAEREQSWFDRFKNWLRDAFDKTQDEADPWLVRWLDEHPISEAVRLALFYGVVLLVILLAVIIIANEIRAARSGRRKSTAKAGGAATFDGTSSGTLDLDADLREERPSIVLRMLIATLIKTGRIQGAHGLTHRELMTRAQFDAPNQHDSFRRVTQLAEQEVFSGKPIASDELHEAVRVGRDLNAQLGGAAT